VELEFSEIHPYLSQESGFNGLHTRWWYSCCCGEDGSWKNRSIVRGGHGRGRGFCFPFYYLGFSWFCGEKKKLWKGFRVFHLGFEEAGGSLLF
jgi:hypothetical protein